MAHDVFISGLLHLVLIASLAFLPARELLAPSRSARLAAGLVCGLTTLLIVALAPLPDAQAGVAVYPTMTAVCTFLFGPFAGAVAALVSLAGQWSGGAPAWPPALGQTAAVWGVGALWHTAHARGPLSVWTALAGLALVLPPALLPWLLNQPVPLTLADSFSEWMRRIPWRYTTGVLVLGGGVELLRSRVQSLQDLRQREEELLLTLEASGGGRWEWNVATRQFAYHGSFYRAFGLDGRPGPGAWEHWNARRHPEDMARIAPTLERAMRGDEDCYYAEFRMLDDQGRWRWLISRGRAAERDAGGRVLRLVGMDLDVTEHHDVQEALHASEVKYTTVYQTLPDAAGITRLADGKYLDVNPAFARLLGMARDTVVGKTSLELNVWASADERARLLEALRLHGEAKGLPMTAYRGAEAIPGHMSARTVRIGEDDCMVFVFHDMTNERRVRDELLAANRLLQQAGWMARLGVWEHDAQDGLVYWSDVCYDIHGLPQGAPLPRDYLRDYVAPAWRDTVEQRFRDSLRGPGPTAWDMEIEVIRADGRPVWVRVRGESVAEDGRVARVRGVMQDIDEWKRAEQRLRYSEERFARIFQLLPYPMGLTRRSDGRYVDVNPAWEQALGYTRAEAVQSSAIGLGIYTPEVRGTLIAAAERDGQLVSYEVEMTVRNGEQRTVLQSMRPIDADGEACWLFALHDITDRKRGEQRVREREELLSLTISAAALGLWDWNLQTGLVAGDARWRAMMGLPPAPDGPAVPWTAGVAPAHIDAITAELERHSAQPTTPFDATWQAGSRWVRSLGKIVSHGTGGQPQRMVGVCIDVTREREQEELLQKLAHYDALTGLPNRVLLARRLQEGMARSRAQGRQLGVAYLDLDGFKPVNDRLGHGAGDRLLVVVAGRLMRSLRAADSVARLGGDEFVILLPGLASRAECERLLRTLMDSVAAPYTLDAERVVVTASIGYTLFPDDDADADALLRHADQAMYAAKQTGRNRFHAFDTAQERALQTQREQGAQITKALREGEFALYLQPKVDMKSGTVVGAEALARWRHPQRGLLAPAAFLHLIDGTELEAPFGEWVADTALAAIERLMDQGLHLPVSINISAQHLQCEGFAAWMASRLALRPRVPAHLLDMEITESAALYDIEHLAGELARLREMGMCVSLDDFGTGYSSLTYLRRLPMDHLKLDQSFVHGMMADSGDLAIVQGVIGLARSFGYRIVAEGVETVEQGQMLLQMGCTLAQGYCIAPPMPLDAFIAWVPTWQPPQGWQRQRPV